MRIRLAEVRRIAMPLKRPWRTAYGQDSAIHSVLLRLNADGVDGWGESCPLYAPTYCPESALSVYETCREFFLPRIVGSDIGTAAELMESLSVYKGNQFAKAAVESAWWALESKLRGVPLYEALGGSASEVICGEDFAIEESIDELLALIEFAVERGAPRIKLKVKHQWDVEVLRAVRGAFPRTVLHVDCNACYDLHDDWSILKEFDRFGLAMIEQPLADTDMVEHAKLQSRIQTPICLDESIKSPRDFRIALEIGACRAVNVKPGRVGGLHHALQIHDMAQRAGVTAWVGGMLESSIGVSICASLASLPGFTYPADIFPTGKFYARDAGGLEVRVDGGYVLDLKSLWAVARDPNVGRIDEVTIARTLLMPPAPSPSPSDTLMTISMHS